MARLVSILFILRSADERSMIMTNLSARREDSLFPLPLHMHIPTFLLIKCMKYRIGSLVPFFSLFSYGGHSIDKDSRGNPSTILQHLPPPKMASMSKIPSCYHQCPLYNLHQQRRRMFTWVGIAIQCPHFSHCSHFCQWDLHSYNPTRFLRILWSGW